MKKNSKKRVLLSSVAMLMVGAVSLGTATYAWFSTKTTADANGINVKSTKASGLLISEDDASWSSIINYNNTVAGKYRAETLAPVSSAFESLTSPVFMTGVAESPDAYKVDTEGFETAPYATAAGYVNVYDLYAKTANEEESELIISFDESGVTDAGEYGRIAIVRYANENIENDENAIKAYYMAADDTAVYPVKNDKTIATAYPVTPVNTISEVNLGKISTSTHFKIFVWNEGQDADCKTTNADKALSFNFDLKLAEN